MFDSCMTRLSSAWAGVGPQPTTPATAALRVDCRRAPTNDTHHRGGDTSTLAGALLRRYRVDLVHCLHASDQGMEFIKRLFDGFGIQLQLLGVAVVFSQLAQRALGARTVRHLRVQQSCRSMSLLACRAAMHVPRGDAWGSLLCEAW